MKKALILMMVIVALVGVSAAQLSQNLIVNGDFSQNTCTQDYCIYLDSTSVPGWAPEPELEIGYGRVYSDLLQN